MKSPVASWLSAPRRWFAKGKSERVIFRCNVCRARNERALSELRRDAGSCGGCGSTVRLRAVVHHVSMALFGKSLALAEFPVRRALHGIGLSDWVGYARPLERRVDYTNTFFHAKPFLDITQVPDAMAGSCDFVISSDVFEHVCPPVSRAFDGARRLLKPGGTLVLTVPFTLEEGDTVEHFPLLHQFEVLDRGREGFRLVNTRADGNVEQFDNLVFHDGPGTTLEMRAFSRSGLQRDLENAGFTDIRFDADPVPEFGIYWEVPWAVPVVARAPGA